MTPPFSAPLISATVKVAVSSLLMVTVAVSVMSADPTPDKLPMLKVKVSLASNLVSPVGVMVKVCVSAPVPTKETVSETAG